MLTEKFEPETKTEIRLLVKKSSVRKLKYLESFSTEIMDMMIDRLYTTFKNNEE